MKDGGPDCREVTPLSQELLKKRIVEGNQILGEER